VLPFFFGSARGAPDRVIETPQGAARAGVEIAHAADHDVGLVVQVEAVVDQFVEVDFGRAFGAAVSSWTP
jgi:hypothetical protein